MTCRVLANYPIRAIVKRRINVRILFSNRWTAYLLLSICLYIAIGQLQHLIRVPYDRSMEVHLWKATDSMVLALPLLFTRKKHWLFPWLLLVNLYLLSIIWYFRTYATIMPLSSYLMFQNLKGLSNSITHSIHIQDSLILIPSLCFVVIYTIYYKKTTNRPRLYKTFAWIFALIFIVSIPYIHESHNFFKRPLHLFTAMSPRAFKEYGIIHFWFYQYTVSCPISSTEKEYAQAYMKRLKAKGYNSRHNISYLSGNNRNLIIIIAESLQSWPIGLKKEEISITPNIDSLLNLPNSLYLPKTLSQVKDGRSSDAQLLINTGLLPLNTGAASSICPSNTFYSLPKALHLKGYKSLSFICDEKEFWNQKQMSVAYGFDRLYDRFKKKDSWDKADEYLFKESIQHIKDIHQPFYTQIVTLSMHEPYIYPQDKNSKLLDLKIFNNEEVRNYLIAVNLFDKRLAHFLQELKKAGLYDNSIIVITGDHEQMTYNQYEGRQELKASDCFVPLIILNSPLPCKHQDNVIGQVDIYPSLLCLMGCNNYEFNGLGENIFGDSISNYATFRTGIAAEGNHVSESVKKSRNELWRISDILLRMDYFAHTQNKIQ